MSATDCRTLHVYRLPVYQKRVIANENYTSNTHNRSPSPNISGRRHSTPPVVTKPTVDINSPPPNPVIKYYHARPTSVNREQNPIIDSTKPPTRPVSLVKLRHQEERVVRLVTTPTSINSFTDIILPIAKKNRSTIVETSNSITSGIDQKSKQKKRPIISLNLEHDIFSSDEDSYEKSKRDNVNSDLKYFFRKSIFFFVF